VKESADSSGIVLNWWKSFVLMYSLEAWCIYTGFFNGYGTNEHEFVLHRDRLNYSFELFRRFMQ
jgi:hypothetical protein